MNKFAALAEANADHYNNHPTTHMTIIAVGAVAAVVAVHAVAIKLSKKKSNPYLVK